MRFLFALVIATVTLASGVARAHPGEFLRNLALHPSNPRVFAIRYEAGLGGFMFSKDGGRTLQIVPGQSFYKYPIRRRIPMLMASDGKLVVAADDGLVTDDGSGCDLNQDPAALGDAWMSDATPHPSDANTTFLLTIPDQASRHAGVWRRDVSGAITAVGTSDILGTTLGDPPFRATSLRVIARAASMGGLRFIEAGLAADPDVPMRPKPVLRVSDDQGVSWTTYPISNTHVADGWPQILLVSSKEPFQALVAIDTGVGEDPADPLDPIFVTRDGGHTFTPYLSEIQVSGEALQLPSGQILLGDRGHPGGLWSAPDFDSAPTKIQEWRVHCLAYQPSTRQIYMCQRHELGFYDAASNSFCAFFRMTETTSFVSCPDTPLEQNTKAKKQLCDGYCSAQHYATAPVCDSFDPGNAFLCAAAARAYDDDAGYISPPGNLASPRCTGFPEPVVDAGASSADAGELDAGLGQDDAGDQQADGDAGSDDEGLDEDEDGRADEDEDEHEDDEDAEADDASASKKRKRRGCDCMLAEGHTDARSSLLALGFALMFVWRRVRRVSRGPACLGYRRE